jgi:pimeloyl-ACP methyl ester carboxylesterase
VIRLVEAASPGGPAALVGSSMGALVAEEAAIARPDLIGNLILMDGCFPSSRKPGGGFHLLALPFIGQRWYRSYRKDPEAAYGSLTGYYADLAGMAEEDRHFLRERVMDRVNSETQERAYFASLRSLIWTYGTRGGFLSRGIGAFGGRVLIIWGEQDKTLPPDSADRLRELCPHAAFVSIPGAGHLPQQDKPRETAGAILRGLGTGGSEAAP